MPQAARPIPRGCPVGSRTHHLGFPVLRPSSLCRHAVAITPVAGQGRAVALSPSSRRPSPPICWVGCHEASFEACSAFTARYGLSARGVAKTTLSIEGFGKFVASLTAPIATGRSDLVAGWELHPLKDGAFPRRTNGDALPCSFVRRAS
jgi:hypothetical protein